MEVTSQLKGGDEGKGGRGRREVEVKKGEKRCKRTASSNCGAKQVHISALIF